jgi:phosphate starvation-inducible PhoH-like protein
LAERIIEPEIFNPTSFYGANNQNLKLIQKYFPKIRIIHRGSEIIIRGDEEEIDIFGEAFESLVQYFKKAGKIDENSIEKVLSPEGSALVRAEMPPGVILFGNDGIVVKAKTPNQQKLVDLVVTHDLVFALGPSGTGKTYTAVALAVRALKNKEVKRIILTRPAVEAGESLGFLPGDLKDKLDPYLQPLYDALRDMIPAEKLKTYLETGVIQIAPLAYMRGRTLDQAFVILDEAQNATENQLKMFLTRMGKTAKFIINGDITQIDLPKNQKSGLITAVNILKNVKEIGFLTFNEKDIIRHSIIKKILAAYDKFENNKITID